MNSATFKEGVERAVPLAIAGVAIVCFVGFALWTLVISLTDSSLLPRYDWVGLKQYRRLFSSGRWAVSLVNFYMLTALMVIGCTALGYALAALIDRCGRLGNVLGTVFLLPLAISCVATGVIWQWLLDPAAGLQAITGALGIGIHIDWLERNDRVIYVVGLAAIWQQTGMSMMLFLAGLRSIDADTWRATRIDGVPAYIVYARIIPPVLKHVFALNTVLLFATAAKSFDLVTELTAGGPGFASDVPARFITEHILERQELALGASAACTVFFIVLIPVALYGLIRTKDGRRS